MLPKYLWTLSTPGESAFLGQVSQFVGFPSSSYVGQEVAK